MDTKSQTQRLAIDLERNEDLARIVADMEPGEKLEATLSIVAKNDKTLTVEIEEVEDAAGDAEEDAAEASGDTKESDDGAEYEGDSPATKVMRGNRG